MTILPVTEFVVPSPEALGEIPAKHLPTFEYAGDYINAFHQSLDSKQELITLKSGGLFSKPIPGWLRPGDALKLYEIAYFVNEDILEIGSYKGLSTTILARACQDSRSDKRVYSIDLNHHLVRLTQTTVKRSGLSSYVHAESMDALDAAQTFAANNKRFEMAFIDHDHTYDAVFWLCRLLDPIITPGGFVLFHDFNDRRNTDQNDQKYGVYQGVKDGLPPHFKFYGIFGCSGLYRKVNQ